MPPRRKKAADDAETPIEGVEGVAPVPQRKPARSRKKPAPASDDGIPLAPHEAPPRRSASPTPIPISKPTEPSGPMPTSIRIEPEARDEEIHDFWSQRSKNDLSVPPKILMESRKVPSREVEDTVEDEEDDDAAGAFRPQVRMGLFRKLAIGFGAIAVLVAALVAYVVYSQATVKVHPRTAAVRTERILPVGGSPETADGVPGIVSEVTVAGEKSAPPSKATYADASATGTVTLINESSNAQTLIATTRLMSAGGVLFRLKSRAVVPAGSRVEAEAYADVPGKAGEIGPSRFTIPGLSAALQQVIYAESSAPMAGGSVPTGTVSEEDIAALEKSLQDELLAQAEQELDRSANAAWTGKAVSTDAISRFVSAAPGETVQRVTVRLTLRVRSVRYDRAKAVAIAAEDLRRGLSSDRVLAQVDGDASEVTVENADPKNGTAAIRVELAGQSVVSISNPLFDLSKLKGRSVDDVRAYFEGIEGIERVDVTFRPFWLKRMPLLEDHIKIEIEI